MTILTGFSLSGQDVTDEKVLCDEAYTVGAVTYYRGYLNYITNQAIEGNDSATYGVWTAAAKGGTRKDVLIEGYPAGSSEVSIDYQEGVVYSTTQDEVLYVRYRAFSPIARIDQSLPLAIYIPGLLESGVAADIFQLKFPKFVNFARAGCYVAGYTGSADATIQVRNAASGGGDGESFVIGSGERTITSVEFSEHLKVTAEQSLYLYTADGKGISDLTVFLWPV